MTNSTTEIPTVTIPSSVHSATHYAYGYISQGVKNMEWLLKKMQSPDCTKGRREQLMEHIAMEVAMCMAMDRALENTRKN